MDPDTVLMDRVQDHDDQGAFEELMRRHDESIVRAMLRAAIFPAVRNRDPALIDDGSNRTWFRVWRARVRWDANLATSGFVGFLVGFVGWAILDILEEIGRRRPGREVPDVPAPPGPDPAVILAIGVALILVLRARSGRDRRAVKLWFFLTPWDSASNHELDLLVPDDPAQGLAAGAFTPSPVLAQVMLEGLQNRMRALREVAAETGSNIPQVYKCCMAYLDDVGVHWGGGQ